jgi:hypothetical protein
MLPSQEELLLELLRRQNELLEQLITELQNTQIMLQRHSR